MSLAAYVDAFQALNVNRAHGHASPHKVCVLLAVMDLVEQGALANNQIGLSQLLNQAIGHIPHGKRGCPEGMRLQTQQAVL